MTDEKLINCGRVMGGQRGSHNSSLRLDEKEQGGNVLLEQGAAMLHMLIWETFLILQFFAAFSTLCSPPCNRF